MMGAPRFFGRRRRLTAAARLRSNPMKNSPPVRPSDQAPIAKPNGRRAADAVQPSLCFHIASYGIESVFKGFLFLILVHASTEISKYIWSILVFFLMRNVLNNHLNDSNVSSYKSAAPKMTISLKWLKPTNTPKGTIPESSAVSISNACKAEIFLCDGIKWLVPGESLSPTDQLALVSL
ncbi:uncharacterized protein [Triticum aestivum]|uniref:uncharacterized protein isoform X2 n=1 Tax=Triticum aestivum TaxID=4565 RepID=UPI001D01C0BB|nr:uncharacterized protein LOC123101916 isoform X2 [Triticum aestivum]XP_044379092.1 uncharacterized protein LOC123101916 isoform X2 [Triticum aestivum]